MTSNQRLTLILVLLAIVIGGILMYNLEYRPIPDVSWDRTYSKESKDPYGSWLFHEVLSDTYAEADMRYSRPDSSTTSTDQLYIRLAQRGSLNQPQLDSVLTFAAKGNTAVIIAGELGGGLDSLIPEIYYYSDSYYRQPRFAYYDPSESSKQDYQLVLYDIELLPEKKQLLPILTFYPNRDEDTDTILGNFGQIYAINTRLKVQDDEVEDNGVQNRHDDYLTDDHYRAEDNQVCLKLPVGDNGGYIYLVTIPSAFSNIGLQQPAMMALVDQFLAKLDRPEVIYYDDTPGTYIPYHSGNGRSPIQYILSDKSLRLAYYLTIAVGLLYLLFKSRRKQKPIPLVEVKKNTSLEYIDTLTKLFVATEQHEKLVQRLEKIFYHQIQRQYFVSKDHPDFVVALSKKARVQEEYIGTLLKRFDEVRQGGSVSVYQLEKITQRIERILQN